MSMYQPVNKAAFKNASVMMEGDTKNEIIVKLMDKDGAAIDLAGKTVTWTAANDRGKLINNRSAAIYLAGEVGIKFLESDSFGDGVIYIQFSVTYSDGSIERFPADNNLFMKVSGSHQNVRYTPVNYVTIEQIESELSAKFEAYAQTVQQGAKGDPGAGLVILGTLTSTAQLPTSTTDGNAYLINGDLHVYANGNWTNAGRIQGPKGDPGPIGNPGPAGSDGKDGLNGKGLQFAWNGYQLGTRIEGDTTYIYSTSLRGATGATGSPGQQGIPGIPGEKGETGSPGVAGKNLEFSWNGYQLGVRQQGETAFTYSSSLRGVQGAQGIPGIPGEKGDPGAGLNIRGTLTSTSQLPAQGAAGDGYIIAGNLHTWDGTAWQNVGPIQGPAGVDGKNLEFTWNGYTLGVRQQGGATYTYSQSLRGQTGLTGQTGQTGATGKNLEFLWNGTQLGVRQEGAATYTYVNLIGPQGNVGQTGQTGAAGKNLEFAWSGTSLGVRQEGATTYTYVNLKGEVGTTGSPGADGTNGVDGKSLEFSWNGYTLGVRVAGTTTYTYSQSLRGATGLTGQTGQTGSPGADGKSLEFLWNGTQLGVRQAGTTTYTYSNLVGPKGDKGDPGTPGTNATLNIELRTSDPASPAAGQVWLRTDLTT